MLELVGPGSSSHSPTGDPADAATWSKGDEDGGTILAVRDEGTVAGKLDQQSVTKDTGRP